MVRLTSDRLSWQRRYVHYGVSVLAVFCAVVLQRALWPYIPPSPQLLFYPAVLVAARCGGFGPGALTVVLSCLAMAHWFLPPADSLMVQADDALDLAIFAAMGFTVALLMSRMRSAMAKARAAWKQADESRARLDAARQTREEMLAIVSHDLRSPLSSIMLSCAQVQQSLRPNSDEALRASCDRIRRAARRMETLVRNLLDAATIEAGNFRIELSTTEVSSLLEGTVKLFEPLARQKSVRLEWELEKRGPITCDHERILQALENLVGNALKFVPRDGQVVVAARRTAGEVVFEVRDSGPGIAPDQLAHVFDRYWTGGGSAGSGLGLYIAKAIAEAHGGRIWVENHAGTTFAFAVPVDRPSSLPAPRPVGDRAAGAGPPSV